MLAVYRRSFKELLIYFFIFNLSWIVTYIVSDVLARYYWCIIRKSDMGTCHHSNLYFENSLLQNWSSAATFAHVFFLLPFFLIYFPLLDYCQRKIKNKRVPYIICGIFMGCSGYLLLLPILQPFVTITLLIISTIFLIIALFKAFFGLLKKEKA